VLELQQQINKVLKKRDMKLLYFMNSENGDFNMGSETTAMCAAYPLSRLKGVTVKGHSQFYMLFESAQSIGTDAENDTKGVDYITISIATKWNHKRAFKDIVLKISDHLAQNNGFIVIADASTDPRTYCGTDWIDDPSLSGANNKFHITLDNPE
tara:strand:+ start:174 stop:635 length:462 start_codon:yes stop_codon:yes gene_type:complete